MYCCLLLQIYLCYLWLLLCSRDTFFKAVVRTNQCWGFHDPLTSLRNPQTPNRSRRRCSCQIAEALRGADLWPLTSGGGALDQRRLVGRGPSLGPVGAGAVAGPLAVEQQQASAGVTLRPEELVLDVREAEPQSCAAIGRSDVLLHAHLPRALDTAAVPIEHVQQRRGRQIHRSHAHVVHCKIRNRQILKNICIYYIYIYIAYVSKH